jgi:hypothetical protein
LAGIVIIVPPLGPPEKVVKFLPHSENPYTCVLPTYNAASILGKTVLNFIRKKENPNTTKYGTAKLLGLVTLTDCNKFPLEGGVLKTLLGAAPAVNTPSGSVTALPAICKVSTAKSEINVEIGLRRDVVAAPSGTNLSTVA